MTDAPSCDLCQNDGGVVLIKNSLFRIVRVLDPNYPAYLRVILNAHVREMTLLTKSEQTLILEAVLACERVLLSEVQAHKVNLASLGNMTPHVHWHVIARFPDDLHFPDAIWSSPKRTVGSRPRLPTDPELIAALVRELAR